MDDFLKNIKDNLDNRAEPKFDPNAWADMENRMAKPESKSRGMIAWWWLPATMLPMMLLNFYLLQKNTALTASNNFESKNSIVEIRTDTIYKTQVVYQTDTVFRTEIRYEKIEVPAPQVVKSTIPWSLMKNYAESNEQKELAKKTAAQTLSNYNPSGFFNRSLEIIKNQNTGVLFSKKNDLKDSQVIKNQEINYNLLDIELVEKLPINQLERAKYDLGKSLAETSFKKKKSAEQRWFETKEMMRPKALRLGGNGALMLPTGNHLSGSYGYSGGISTIIDFSENFRLTGDLTYNVLELRAKKSNENFGIPEVPTTPDDFEFKNALADQQSVEFGVGFQYLLSSKKRIKPFLGAGYSVISLRPYEVEYNFENPITGVELISPKDISRSDLITNLGFLNAGFEFSLTKKISLQSEMFYRQRMGDTGILTPNVLGVKARAMYKF